MSAEKYGSHTGVSRATAYRELNNLGQRGRPQRTGQGRGTRCGLVVGG